MDKNRDRANLISFKANNVNFKSQKLKPKPQSSQSHIVIKNSDSKCPDEFSLLSGGSESVNQASLVKEELNSGLKKIMADLADLDIPTLTQKISKEETDIIENSKENDFPVNQSHSEHTVSTVPKETWTKRPLPSSRLMKESSNDAANILRNSKFDSKKSSTSSLNSLHRTSFSLDSEDNRPLKPPVRPRSYDPEKAREYIRQQKQERLNRLREERERQQADMLARKQKLDELSKTSLKLVKASIKRKSNQGNVCLTDDQSIEPVLDLNINENKSAKIDGDLPDNPIQNESLRKFSENFHQNLPEQFSLSNIPPSLDDSNAQLIKDICEMKSRIEAMAKSLKTTIVSNRAKAGKTSNTRLESSAKADPVALPSQPLTSRRIESVISDSNVTKRSTGGSAHRQYSEVNGYKRLISDSADLDESHINSPYLQNLTSNLRKMRESLQTLLAQNNVVSSASSEKTRANRSRPPRHRRFSSAGSDTAFEAMKIEANKTRVPSLDGDISNSLEKKQIATSFPTLPLAEPQSVNFERKRFLSTSSETGVYGKFPLHLLFVHFSGA